MNPQPDLLCVLPEPRFALGEDGVLARSRLAKSAKLTESGCMEWQKHKSGTGYPGISFNKPFLGHRRWRAHRLSYFVFVGELTEPMVCHACDNPVCINPNHLFLGTAMTNRQDAFSKGRLTECVRNGEKCQWHKLTAAQALEVFRSNSPRGELARKFGVTTQAIAAIKHRRCWKWLTDNSEKGNLCGA